jgi:hypothetical protein
MTAGGLPEGTAQLAALATARKRSVPQVTVSMMVALRGDPALPDEDTLIRQLTDIDGPFGIPAEYVRQTLVAGSQEEIGAQLADSAKNGASRVVVSFAGGNWNRQAELLAGAKALLG